MDQKHKGCQGIVTHEWFIRGPESASLVVAKLIIPENALYDKAFH